jgi:hypothetical protein
MTKVSTVRTVLWPGTLREEVRVTVFSVILGWGPLEVRVTPITQPNKWKYNLDALQGRTGTGHGACITRGKVPAYRVIVPNCACHCGRVAVIVGEAALSVS